MEQFHAIVNDSHALIGFEVGWNGEVFSQGRKLLLRGQDPRPTIELAKLSQRGQQGKGGYLLELRQVEGWQTGRDGPRALNWREYALLREGSGPTAAEPVLRGGRVLRTAASPGT